MDLLKDITQGLRGSGETRRDERARTSGRSRRDASRRSSTGGSDGVADEETVESSDPNREDKHVCSFCEAEFDASRGVCPECDAEIVFRGER